jgi:DNA-binding response OmpR family regulator
MECALPIQRAKPAKTASSSDRFEGTERVPKILIVEDELRYGINLMRALTDFSSSPYRLDVDITPDPKVAYRHADLDDIDIYIVDLKLRDEESPFFENREIGNDLIEKILKKTNAGLIIHSSLEADENAASYMMLGADDYIQKASRKGGSKEIREGSRILIKEKALHEIIMAKVIAVWRRVQQTRPDEATNFAHTNRTFLIGDWKFIVGNRELVNLKGQKIRVTPTEHALLKYLSVVKTHEIDIETFNLEILGRSSSERDRRVDNYVYRIRTRLGPSVELVSNRERKYRLLTVVELFDDQTFPPKDD